MNKKNFWVVLWMMVSAFVWVSCSDDDETSPMNQDTPPVDEETELEYDVNPRAFALKFHDFIDNGEENIKRLDEDTLQIEINEDLLTSLGIAYLQKGDALNIWESIDTPPYIRVVDEVERTASGYKVTTHEGGIEDIFHTLEGCFDTELFSDISDRPVRSNVRSGHPQDETHLVDGEEDFLQFVDDEGKLHPFILYVQDQDDSDKYKYELSEKKYDALTDSVLGTRLVSWDKTWHLINVNKNHINIHPEVDKNSAPFGLFVTEGSLELKADLEIYFQLNLIESNRFWAKMSGGINVEAPIHLKLQGVQFKAEKEIPVFEFAPIFTVFSLGPFVLPVVIRNGFIFKSSAEFNGNISMMLPFYYRSSVVTGPKYEDGHWSSFKSFDWNAGINYEKMTVLPTASMSLEAGVGFYFHTGAYLGSVVGPYFEFGPQTEMSANTSVTEHEVLFNTNGSVSLGGEVGAEIKFWKFNLGKAKIPYTVVSKDLWDVNLSFSKEDIVNAMRPQ